MVASTVARGSRLPMGSVTITRAAVMAAAMTTTMMTTMTNG
jgi:hypothetical protein